MSFDSANRKVHYWISIALALPVLVIIVTGLMLQLKKQWHWVQPPEMRGSVTAPVLGFEEILAAMVATPSLGVDGWDDVNRLDVRPSKGIVKVWLVNGWEVQVDLGDARVLHAAYRRSDLIESLHDGSFFAGDATKLGVFLPAGAILLVSWLTGMWLFFVPYLAKRRRRSRAR